MSLIPAFEIGLWNAWIPMLYLTLSFPFFTRIAIKQGAPSPAESELSMGGKIVAYSSKLLLIPALIYSIFLPPYKSYLCVYILSASFNVLSAWLNGIIRRGTRGLRSLVLGHLLLLLLLFFIPFLGPLPVVLLSLQPFLRWGCRQHPMKFVIQAIL